MQHSVFDPLSAIAPAAAALFTGGVATAESAAADIAGQRAELMRETANELLGPQTRVSGAQPQGTVGQVTGRTR